MPLFREVGSRLWLVGSEDLDYHVQQQDAGRRSHGPLLTIKNNGRPDFADSQSDLRVAKAVLYLSAALVRFLNGVS